MPNEKLGNTIRAMGWISVVVGVIIAIFMVAKAGDAMFGGEEIAIIGVLIGLIFVMLGIACVGVGQVLMTLGGTPPQATSTFRTAGTAEPESAMTVCSECGAKYTRDLSGQFCESCGATL